MDPNFGSGNQLLGGGNEALRQVMQQQGIDTGVLDQQTPGSAGFNPATQQMPGGPAPMSPPQGQPMPPMPPPQAGGPTTQVGQPLGSSEAQLIIQVLGDRLKNISTVEKQSMKPPEAPTAPQVPQF